MKHPQEHPHRAAKTRTRASYVQGREDDRLQPENVNYYDQQRQHFEVVSDLCLLLARRRAKVNSVSMTVSSLSC